MIEIKKNQKCFVSYCDRIDVMAVLRHDAIVCNKHGKRIGDMFGNLEFRKYIKIEGVVLE